MIARLIVVAVVACWGCGGGGQSPPCEHTFDGSRCCLSSASCRNAQEFCAPPNSAVGCGACDSTPGTCVTDDDCRIVQPATICEPRQCACFPDSTVCVPGCTTDSDCGVGQSCDVATNRCDAQPCSTAPCPDNFDCRSGRCARRACVDFADCEGFCVEGLCFEQAGECRPPAA